MTDASGGVTTFGYSSPDSGMVTVTDPAGQAEAYAWDAGLDLTSVTSPSGGVTSFTYNQWGEKLTEIDPNGLASAGSHWSTLAARARRRP